MKEKQIKLITKNDASIKRELCVFYITFETAASNNLKVNEIIDIVDGYTVNALSTIYRCKVKLVRKKCVIAVMHEEDE